MSFLITDSLSVLDKLEMNLSIQFSLSNCWIIFSFLLNPLLLLARLEEALSLLTRYFEELVDEDEENLQLSLSISEEEPVTFINTVLSVHCVRIKCINIFQVCFVSKTSAPLQR